MSQIHYNTSKNKALDNYKELMPPVVSQNKVGLSLHESTPYFAKGKFRVVAAKNKHIHEVTRNLRKQDRDEIHNLEKFSGSSRTIEKVIAESLKFTELNLALLENDTPIAFGGVAAQNNFDDTWLCPWLLGSHKLENNLAAFRFLKLFFNKYIALKHQRLINITFCRENSLNIKWLKSLRFSVFPLNKENLRADEKDEPWVFFINKNFC